MSAEGRLGELLEELIETLKASPDPFKVRVRELLEELAGLLPRLRAEELQLDAEILYRLAEVVRRQDEWLASEAATLALGKLVAALKVQALSGRELALQLLRAWRPIVELEQVTFTDILRAVEYMGGRRPRAVFEGSGEEVGVLGPEAMAALGLLPQVELERVVERVRRRVGELIKCSGAAKYVDAVAERDAYETYLNAYAISLLSSAGELDVAYDPLSEDYYIVRGGGSGDPSSIVIPLRRVVASAR